MNFKTATLGVLVCGLLATNAFAQTLPALQTGNISFDNNSDADYLTVNWDPESKNIGLLQFDLSAYASFSGTATLNLFHTLNDGNVLGKNAVFKLYQNTSSWDSLMSNCAVNSCVWNDRPTYDTTPVATLTIGDSDTFRWRSVDVTAAVSSWISGSMLNYGFTLERFDQDNPYIYFAAQGVNIDTGENLGPTLTLVTAAVPEPETYAMMLAGLGLLSLVARRRKQNLAA